MITYGWRGAFENVEVSGLHAAAFGQVVEVEDWIGRVQRHSLGWVCARDDEGLVGFVNVAWDGGRHAFLLDTMVDDRVRRQGVGTGLVEVATQHARTAGCGWLHVDFEDHLRPFYLQSAGFTETGAGILRLRG